MSCSVGPGTWVKLHYAVRDADGEVVAEETIERLFGFGQLLPSIEQAIGGASPGSSKTARLRSEDGFGQRDPAAVVEVERAEFPPDADAGDHFQAEDAEGNFVLLTVLDVNDERVVVDQNHPLAGQSLAVDLDILDVRVADSEEIQAAETALLSAAQPDISLIPTQALLAGGQRRYEDVNSPEGAEPGSRGRRGNSGDKS